jgi:hypothetical protein
MYGSQGIHGIGRAVALQLERADGDTGDAVEQQPAHLDAPRRAGVLRDRLVRRRAGRHQDDVLEPQLAARMARDREVPEMRRVERAAEDAERAKLLAAGRGGGLRRGRVRRPPRGT